MSQPPLDPYGLPEDATGAETAGYILEDLARDLMLRLSMFTAFISVVAGIGADGSSGVRIAAVAAGVIGFVLVPALGFAGVRRTRLWSAMLGTLVVCGALIGVLIAS